MAARGRPTIAPEKVSTLDQWLKYYKLRYGNIVLGEDGSYLVLDPKLSRQEGLEAPVKTIPHMRAHDFVAVLASKSAPQSLRVAAEERKEAIHAAHQTAVSGAYAQFQEIERQLLEATDAWESATDLSARKTAAEQIGVLSKALGDAAEKYSEAKYPHRYIHTELDATNALIDYRTHDPRPYGAIYRMVPVRESVSDRTFVKSEDE